MPSRLRFSFRDAIAANKHIRVVLDALTCLPEQQAVRIFGHFSRGNVAERLFPGARTSTHDDPGKQPIGRPFPKPCSDVLGQLLFAQR